MYLGAQDGAAVLRRLQEKQAAGQALTREDQVDLIFLPLMTQERTLDEVVPAAARVAATLPGPARTQAVEALLGLAYSKMSTAVVANVLKEMGMQSVLEQLIEARLLEAEAENEARLQQAVAQAVEQAVAETQAQAEVRVQEAETRVRTELAMSALERQSEGRAEGLREGLRLVLAQRFGAIPPVVNARITAATAAELDGLMAHAVTISTIDAF